MNIIQYKHPAFIGKTLMIDESAIPSFKKIGDYAIQSGVKHSVNSSFRVIGAPVPGAIVPPAHHSYHFKGRAMDSNPIDELGMEWTSEMLLNGLGSGFTPGLKKFFDLVKADADLRWGGDLNMNFQPIDVVHIDNGGVK